MIEVAVEGCVHPAREARPALVFLRGELMALPIPLERNEVVLGRAIEADVRVNDAKASRRHAVIYTEQDPLTGETVYRLVDLQSLNGTLLNGQRVTEAYLQEGDKIGIGQQIVRFALLDKYDREYQRHIHRLLVRDELTGLLTSRSFFSELRREATRAEAEGKPFAVLMLDVDYFKRVNDTYGHLTGNQVLEQLGDMINESLRAGDVAARFGGEEFVVYLTETNEDQAWLVAERLRAIIAGQVFSASPNRIVTSQAKPDFQITVSIGFAIYPSDGCDPIELVEMADSALYRAKRTGRNQVCSFRQLAHLEQEITAPALEP